MIEIDIPGFGLLQLEHLVTDFSGTLSVDGELIEGVAERLTKLADKLQIHIITADTHGKVKTAVEGINCSLDILEPKYQHFQKEKYILSLGARWVVAFGNGVNDKLMLKTSQLGIAVCLSEGTAFEAVRAANVLVTSILDGLDLLLFPNRLIATLRY